MVPANRSATNGAPATCTALDGAYSSRTTGLTAGAKVNANYYETGYFYAATVVTTGTDSITNEATITVEFSEDTDGSVVLPATSIIPQTELASGTCSWKNTGTQPAGNGGSGGCASYNNNESGCTGAGAGVNACTWTDTFVWARPTEAEAWAKCRVIFMTSTGNYLVARGGIQLVVPDKFNTIRPYQTFGKGDRAWCSNGDYRWFECEIFDVTETTTDFQYHAVYDDGRSYDLYAYDIILIHHYKGLEIADHAKNKWVAAADVVNMLHQCGRSSIMDGNCNNPSFQKCGSADVTCANGGTVKNIHRHTILGDCACDCPAGYWGRRCENDPTCQRSGYACAVPTSFLDPLKRQNSCPSGVCTDTLCCTTT